MKNVRLTARTLAFLPLLSLASLTACSATPPPKELTDARDAYKKSKDGAAAKESPAKLHEAEQALDVAEKRFKDDPDAPEVKDLAYVALRKVEIADAAAATSLAVKEKDMSERGAQQAQADALRSTQDQLKQTQEQLDRERHLRSDAEKRAAQALADLQRIAAVKQETRGTIITLSGAVLFKTGEAKLLAPAMVQLNQVADALTKANPDAPIEVDGYTDNQGKGDTNLVLSQKRADSVADYLISRGIAKDRVKAFGKGPDNPIADNTSTEGRAQNRRVEIVVGNGNK
jgi:outer membrane protein OmpA-like peptidoglycan-associated protein